MQFPGFRQIVLLVVLAFVLAACAPAEPTPTAAPAKTVPTAAPAQPKQQPAASPVAKPAASPAAKAAEQPAPKPAQKPAEKAAAQAGFDEQAVADFYRGKTIRLIVGASAGGGYDTYSRLIARHMPKYLPGNPNMIVENMPGGGFLLAANHVYNVAPKDGTVLVNFSIRLALQQVFGLQGVEFDAARFQYLGVPTTDTSLCEATRASGLTSLAGTIGPGGEEFIVGGSAPGDSTVDEPKVLAAALGANINLVPGYGGTSAVRLAMDQGEVEGICGWSWESVRATGLEKVQSGEYVIISQNVEQAHPDLPDVPVAYELATTEEGRQLFRFGLTLPSLVQRMYAAPPGVPAVRVQALRAAFDRTMEDQAFLAEAEQAQLAVDPFNGRAAQERVDELVSMPPEIRARLQDILLP